MRSHPSAHLVGLLCIIFGTSLWGTFGPSTQMIFQLAPTLLPQHLAFWRMALAVPLLLSLAMYQQGTATFRLRVGDSGAIVGFGLCMAAYVTCYAAAIERLSVAVATLIAIGVPPVLVAVLSAVVFKERLEGGQRLGLTVAVAATVLLAGAELGVENQAGVGGLFYAGGAACSLTAITFLGKRLAGTVPALTSTSLGFATGALTLGLASQPWTEMTAMHTQVWGHLAYQAVVPTGIGYLLYLRGLASTSATLTAAATLLEPLWGAVIAWLLLGERLSPTGCVAAIMLVGALGLMARRGGRCHVTR